jgi:hypothetical protein
MAKYFKRPFAETGLKTAIPTDTTIDNSVSYETGWTTDYEIDPVADPVNAKYPELRNFNQLFYNVTQNIKELQEQTYPDWIADDESGSPFAYSSGAVVTYTDGKQYVSLVDNNDEEPTAGSQWIENQRVYAVDTNYTDLDAIGANPQATLWSDGTITGSTDNGSYTKYPNGDLFCKVKRSGTLALTTAYGGVYHGSAIVFYYPIAFDANRPEISLEIIDGGGGYLWPCSNTYLSSTLTNYTSKVISPTSRASVNYQATLTAIGKWK